jgi:type VI secretion system secreted protein Hcp
MKARRITWLTAFVLGTCLFAAAIPASAAVDAYLKIENGQQIKGTGRGQWDGWVPVSSVAYAVEAPRDAASGLASGKRQHQPITIRREVDSASPKLAQMCASGKHFATVDIAYVNARGEITKQIHLEDAMIGAVRKAGGNQEELEFTFQKIELRNKEGKTVATDDWTRSN